MNNNSPSEGNEKSYEDLTFKLGKKKFDQGDYRGAIKAFQNLEKTPGITYTVEYLCAYYLTLCFDQIGNDEEAEKYRTASISFGESYSLPPLERALSIIKKLSGNSTDNPEDELSVEEVLEGEGRYLYESGEYKKALGYFLILDEVSDSEVFRFTNFVSLAKCYAELGNKKMALYYYSKAVERTGRDETKHFERLIEESRQAIQDMTKDDTND